MDGRCSIEQRQVMANEIVDHSWCCVGRFWWRLLDQVFPGEEREQRLPERLREPEFQRVLYGMLPLLDDAMSIADLERRNKRTKTVVVSADT